jgi:histone H3/H4
MPSTHFGVDCERSTNRLKFRKQFRAKRMLVGRATTSLLRAGGIKRASKNVAQAIYDNSVTTEMIKIHKVAACLAQLHGRKTIKDTDMQMGADLVCNGKKLPKISISTNGKLKFEKD